MATPETLKEQVDKQKPMKDLRSLIIQSANDLKSALPEHLRAERLVRIALTNLRTNPDLVKCTQESFLGALFTSAQLGVEPIAGRAYILPFQNNRKKADGTWHKVWEAQFMLGYKGVSDLFYRHEKAVMLSWGIVKMKDEFSYEYGTEAYLKHIPGTGDRGGPVAYWIMATLSNGGKSFMVMSHEECMAHGQKHSKTWVSKEWSNEKKQMVDCEPHFVKSSPWITNPESMCLKTTFVQLAKILPLSYEVQRAIEADESSREYKQGIKDVLDLPNMTNWDPDPEPPLPKLPEAPVTVKPPEIEFGK